MGWLSILTQLQLSVKGVWGLQMSEWNLLVDRLIGTFAVIRLRQLLHRQLHC